MTKITAKKTFTGPDDKGVGGARTHFYHAEEGLNGEYNAAGSQLRAYGYKPESTWTPDPLFMKETGQYYFCHNGHLGMPQKITAVNGAVVWSASYSFFGKFTIEIETVENNLRFPGQHHDSEIRLHYNWHCYYDPSTGRYLTPDPIGLVGGINLFSYVSKNPLNSINRLGVVEVERRPEYPGTVEGCEQYSQDKGQVMMEFIPYSVTGQALCICECKEKERKGKYKCKGYAQYELTNKAESVLV